MATYGGYGLGGFTGGGGMGGGMGSGMGGGMDMQGFLGMLMQLARRYQGQGGSTQAGQFPQGQGQAPQWRDPASVGAEPPPLSGPFSQGFDPTSAEAQDRYTQLYNQAQGQYGVLPGGMKGPTLPGIDSGTETAYNTAYNKAMFGGAQQRFGPRPDYSAGPVRAPVSQDPTMGMTRQAV